MGLTAVLIKVRLFSGQLRSQPDVAPIFLNMLFRFMDRFSYVDARMTTLVPDPFYVIKSKNVWSVAFKSLISRDINYSV